MIALPGESDRDDSDSAPAADAPTTPDVLSGDDRTGSADGPSRASVNRRRLLLLGGVTALTTVAGLGASRWVRSPQQVLADQRPPAPTTLTAAVQRRVLRDTVVLRGQVGAAGTFEVTPAPHDVERAVVSAVRVRAGGQIRPGEVLVEVAGRPLVALPGSIPAYRDMHAGSTGKDVRQLQRALASLGFGGGDAGDMLGPRTKRALSRFYDSLGYSPPTDGDPLALAGAQDRVRIAQRTLTEAKTHLRLLRAARAKSADPTQPDPITEAQDQVRFATEDLGVAQAALNEVERTSGAMLPLAEVVFLPAFPSRVEKLTASAGAEVKAPMITISSGALVVRAKVNPGQRTLLKPGMRVDVTSEVIGKTVSGTIASIGDLTADDTGSQSHPMTVKAAGPPWPAGLAGQDVRLTVTAASSDGDVLVVPVSALFAGADGRVAVLRLTAQGQQRVVVTPAGSGDGYVAVTPVDGPLGPGDTVVVGAGYATPTPS